MHSGSMTNPESHPDPFPDELEIDVTRDHIDRGYRGNCGRCPVALALAERYPDYVINVGPWDVVLYNTKLQVSRLYHLPYDVCCWIAAFDIGRPVTPLTVRYPPRPAEPFKVPTTPGQSTQST